MRVQLYPKIAPWLRLLALCLSAPARYWWVGLIIIGALLAFDGVSWGQALLLGLAWALTIGGSVVALGVLAAIESRWRAEWTASRHSPASER